MIASGAGALCDPGRRRDPLELSLADGRQSGRRRHHLPRRRQEESRHESRYPLARPAAEIAEAAATLRKFWPMHDWLYENQEEWRSYRPEGLAAGLQAPGIDEAAVARAIRGPDIETRINADFGGGVRSGVNATPCFFVNGYRYGGGADSLKHAIEDLIQRL